MAKIPELPDIDIEALMGGDHTEWESEVALVYIYKALAAMSYDIREMRKKITQDNFTGGGSKEGGE